ncbi:MAG TPA: radical SAM protein [Mycobacteriales bacterium]|nr:radical SAM protein [Mycobacteriales bacterium]
MRVQLPVVDTPPQAARGADTVRQAPGTASEATRVSPNWVRISMASAIALRFRSGRFSRDFDFGGINLLLNYEDGCRSDCSYCGLARTRPGTYQDKSFIRVEWPLVETDELVDRMARHQAKLTRLCISMVTHGRSYPDTCEITRRIRARVRTPLSILVAPPTLNRQRLETFRALGVDMIGVGLDAVTEDLFRRHRTDVPAGGLSWSKYWEVVGDARDVFGAWKVNCHTLVGLGETDRDLLEMFVRLHDRQIFSYLFCFNPEPDSRLGQHPKSPIQRWRRLQLAKHLIETEGQRLEDFRCDDEGGLVRLSGPASVIEGAVASAVPFMTNGCPGESGEPGCTRPYGSYQPSESFRDYPFLPAPDDLAEIREQLGLEVLVQR